MDSELRALNPRLLGKPRLLCFKTRDIIYYLFIMCVLIKNNTEHAALTIFCFSNSFFFQSN